MTGVPALVDSPFLAACRGERPSRTPVWYMRQAGRSLPEYRALREGVGMLESCMTPDLTVEITLQPVRRYGVDAAIFFSDIVLPLKAVGVDLDIVAGVGPVVAASIHDFFGDPANRRLVQRLIDAGVNIQGPERSVLPQTLSGRSVVVTGSVPGHSRESAEAAVKARGGKSPGSVSKKTFAVVVGDDPGASKVTKAESLGVPMVSAALFEELLETGEIPTGGGS